MFEEKKRFCPFYFQLSNAPLLSRTVLVCCGLPLPNKISLKTMTLVILAALAQEVSREPSLGVTHA